MTTATEEIVVFDFGSQFAQLIARRIREHEVFCRVVTPTATAADSRARALKGIILSGGPASVYDPGAPTIDPEDPRPRRPGARHLLRHAAHGAPLRARRWRRAPSASSAARSSRSSAASDLFDGTPPRQVVWMSHGDRVETAMRDFEVDRADRDVPDRRRAARGAAASTASSSTPRSPTPSTARGSSATS